MKLHKMMALAALLCSGVGHAAAGANIAKMNAKQIMALNPASLNDEQSSALFDLALFGRTAGEKSAAQALLSKKFNKSSINFNQLRESIITKGLRAINIPQGQQGDYYKALGFSGLQPEMLQARKKLPKNTNWDALKEQVKKAGFDTLSRESGEKEFEEEFKRLAQIAEAFQEGEEQQEESEEQEQQIQKQRELAKNKEEEEARRAEEAAQKEEEFRKEEEEARREEARREQELLRQAAELFSRQEEEARLRQEEQARRAEEEEARRKAEEEKEAARAREKAAAEQKRMAEEQERLRKEEEAREKAAAKRKSEQEEELKKLAEAKVVTTHKDVLKELRATEDALKKVMKADNKYNEEEVFNVVKELYAYTQIQNSEVKKGAKNAYDRLLNSLAADLKKSLSEENFEFYFETRLANAGYKLTADQLNYVKETIKPVVYN